MYAIKIMSSENKADSDVGKGFKMIMVEAGDTFEFGHDSHTGKPQVTVTGYRQGEPTYTTYPVTGNCYVVSETGKTIASFWGRSLWGDCETTTQSEGSEPRNGISQDSARMEIVQELVRDYASRSFPNTDNCAVMRKRWEDQGLTNCQIMMLSQPKRELAKNQDARDKAYRSRVGELMGAGIPQFEAIEASIYLLGDTAKVGTPE